MSMFDLDRWEEIWATISRNKWRSFMTAMSVFWAVLMLIIMSGAGIGLEKMLLGKVGAATNAGILYAGKTSEAYMGFKENRRWEMDNDDIEILRARVGEIKEITGIVNAGYLNMVNGDKSHGASVEGIATSFYEYQSPLLLYGRALNNIDVDSERKVCTIGLSVYESLFPSRKDPVGERILIGQHLFTIAGVHDSPTSGVQFSESPSRMVYIPISIAQRLFKRNDKISNIIAIAKDDAPVHIMLDNIEKVLKEQHPIAPTDTKALMKMNLSELFKIFGNLFLGLRSLIWIVGLGSLFAGIIGVSNIMLIVVKERTQEIGVRRALGAKPSAIISQIMSESFVLTFIAGVMGLGVSVAILALTESIFAAQAAHPNSTVPAFSPMVTFEFAIVTSTIILISGLLAGIIPALRAMAIKPVDAIREE